MSSDDISAVRDNLFQPASLTWNVLSEDPIKEAVLRAILSFQRGLTSQPVDVGIVRALTQNAVCPSFLFIEIEVDALLRVFSILPSFLLSSIP